MPALDYVPLIMEREKFMVENVGFEIIDIYFRAWAEPDARRRGELLKQAWEEDGVYSDPSAHVIGRTALIEHIGNVWGVIRAHASREPATSTCITTSFDFLGK